MICRRYKSSKKKFILKFSFSDEVVWYDFSKPAAEQQDLNCTGEKPEGKDYRFFCYFFSIEALG